MRSKVLLSILVIAIAAALLAGATGAWFTGEDTLDEAVFTAGTVEVEAGEAVIADGYVFDNVNPGDEVEVCWEITNIGTKSAEFRVEIPGAVWTLADGVEGDLPEVDDVVEFTGCDNWVDGGDGFLYYIGGPVSGTYGDVAGGTAELCLTLTFNGDNMRNLYQGATCTFGGGTVEAIQSTNGAADDVWGDAWAAINNPS